MSAPGRDGRALARRREALALVLALAAAPAGAAPLSSVQAQDALAAEHVRCAASYAVGLRCFAGTLDAARTRDFRRARDVALNRGYAYGRKAGLSDAALLARTDAAMAEMKGIAGEGCRDAAALVRRFGPSCKALVQDPEARLRQLTDGAR